MTGRYADGVHYLMRHTALSVALVGALLVATGLLYRAVPSSLAPSEDQGYVIAIPILPGCRVARAHGGRAEAAQPRGAEPSGRGRSARDVGHRRADVHAAYQHRRHLDHAQGLGSAQVQGPVRFGSCRVCPGRRREDPRRDGARVRAAADRRSRHDRWLRGVHPVARRRRLPCTRTGHAAVHRRGGEATRSSPMSPRRSRRACRRSTSISTASRRSCSASSVNDVFDTLQSTFGAALRQRLQPWRPCLPRAPAVGREVPRAPGRHPQRLRARATRTS